MKEPRFDVYRLEVYEPTYSATFSGGPEGKIITIPIGGRLFVDVVIPDFNFLRRNVYEAMTHGCGELWITHLGERRLVTTCAQFEAEYGRRKGN